MEYFLVLKEQTSDVLLSQAATRQVPSTLEDFTSVFGMGTGVSPPPSSLDMNLFTNSAVGQFVK